MKDSIIKKKKLPRPRFAAPSKTIMHPFGGEYRAMTRNKKSCLRIKIHHNPKPFIDFEPPIKLLPGELKRGALDPPNPLIKLAKNGLNWLTWLNLAKIG